MKRVCLIAGSANTRLELARQLAEYIEGGAELASFAIDSGMDAPIDGDLVVVSSQLIGEELAASGLLAPDAPLLVARRTIDCAHLDLVVALPPGTKALFVNDRRETAEECIAALTELGLDGVDYTPYYPGAPTPPSDIGIAITAGESSLVPSSIAEVIDIGVRILDFGTIAEILVKLELLDRGVGSFSRRYLAAVVSVARRLARSTEETQRLNAHLSNVIDSLSHGILVYDGSGRVAVCSENLRSLLGLRPGEGIGRSLATIIRNEALLAFLGGPGTEESGVFHLATGQVLVSRFRTAGGSTIAAFRDDRGSDAEGRALAREYRKRGYVAKYTMDDIVGSGESITRAKRIAMRLAATDLSILIHGESGTGKELFASSIHAGSGRASGPFLAVDLGSLSDDLIESELFGYEEGAFTGAKKGGKAGLFELADGGTLFLDEIGNVSPKVQRRLLRVLQEKEIMRVGGSGIKRVDVRIIAATNEDLLERAARGEFREDLYFRLKMGWIRIPPLRERLEDLPMLVSRLLSLEGAADVSVESDVLEALAARDWPGNVRELRNALTYMIAVRDGPSLTMADFPEDSYFAQSACIDSRIRPSEPYHAGGDEPNDSDLEPADRSVLRAVAELEAGGRRAGR